VQTAVNRHREESFELVFHRLGPALYRHALAILRDRSAAEDVVQDAFVRVWRRRSRLTREQRLDGYLFTAVRNLALDQLRRGKVAAASQVLVAVAPTASEPPACDAEGIDAALGALPPEQREVVVLHVHVGLSFAEIAGRTGTPLGTVHSRYRYAMTRLRDALRTHAPGGEA
jgi:RNA polymerase sigma-70 factor (ECF subfamily)